MSGSVIKSVVTALVLNLPDITGNRAAIPQPHLPAAEQAAFAVPGAAGPEIPALPVATVSGIDGPPGSYDPRHWGENLVPDAGYRQSLARSAEGLARISDPLEASRDRIAHEMLAFDADIRSHSMRVALLAGSMARKLGFAEGEARDLAWSARVHDVGKADPRILELVNSPGKLTEEQRRVVAAHTTLGARLIEGRSDLDPRSRALGSDVALNHHERMDGRGYPRGIDAARASYASRVVHVADYFDALMERRPYKNGMSVLETLGALSAVRRQFDPAVWSALIAVIVEPVASTPH